MRLETFGRRLLLGGVFARPDGQDPGSGQVGAKRRRRRARKRRLGEAAFIFICASLAFSVKHDYNSEFLEQKVTQQEFSVKK